MIWKKCEEKCNVFQPVLLYVMKDNLSPFNTVSLKRSKIKPQIDLNDSLFV